MKKLVSVLFALLLVGGFAFASDITFSGDLGYIIANDEDSEPGSNLAKERVRLNATVADFNTVTLELRNDAGGNELGDFLTTKFFYMTTDIGAALGLEGVGISAMTGRFEYWLSNWNSATSWNRARKVEMWTIGGDDADGAAALEVTAGKVKLHSYINPSSENTGFKLGLSSSSIMEGLNFIASFSDDEDTDGYFKAEAGYTTGNYYVPASFVYDLATDIVDYGIGVSVSNLSMFKVNLGLGGKFAGDAEDYQVLDVADLEVYANVTETTALFAKFYTSPTDDENNDSILQSVDVGVKNKFGAATFYAGYVYADSDEFVTALCEDDSTDRYGVTGSGLYFATKISF
jgi:hypothetical protein